MFSIFLLSWGLWTLGKNKTTTALQQNHMSKSSHYGLARSNSTAILQMVSMSLQLVIKQKTATVQSVAAVYPLSYWGGYLNFSTILLKNGYYCNRKRQNNDINSSLWNIKQRLWSMSLQCSKMPCCHYFFFTYHHFYTKNIIRFWNLNTQPVLHWSTHISQIFSSEFQAQTSLTPNINCSWSFLI